MARKMNKKKARGSMGTARKAKAKAKGKKATTSRTAARASVARTATKGEVQPVDRVAKAVKKARTKSDVMAILAECAGLSKKEVAAIFDKLQDLINLDLSKKGPGVFNMPGLMKIVRVTKPATKARKGINPFTKEPMTFKAKPARNVVKVRALKALKAMVQ